MKKIKLLAISLTYIVITAYSQVGVNTANPNSSAALDIKAVGNNSGLLIPGLTTVQQNNISNPANGLLIYNKDAKMFYYYDSTLTTAKKWLPLSPWRNTATVNTPSVIATNSVVTAVGINTPNPTERLEVTGNAKITGTIISTYITNSKSISTATLNVTGFPYNSLIPAGGIIMWTGVTAPSSWALCDGTQGTPDLRGRFILSSGQNQTPVAGDLNPTYAIGQTGGENQHLLTGIESALPVHTHSLTISGNTDIDGSHKHAIAVSGGVPPVSPVPILASDANDAIYNTNVDGVHSHHLTLTGTTNSNTAAPASQAHENRPPYYVLAFIMKLN